VETLGVFLLLVFFIAPISLLFHEIGHVMGAKWANASSIQLTIGVGNKLWAGSISNLQITVRSLFMINSFTSTTRKNPYQRKEKIMITMMGPLFSGLLAIIIYGVYFIFIPSQMMYIFFLFNLWLVFINVLPFKIGQKQSDGYIIYTLLLKKAQ